MARTVAEGLWEMLASAGVRRCYGIVGDALNPVIDALRRNGSDFSQVATALGARGIRVEEPGDVRDALQAALAHTGGPVVVDVVVDPYALALPSHVPAATAKGFTLSMAKQVFTGKMDEVIETIEHNVRLL